MAYIKTPNISVFPSALRTKDLSGKYTSENNFTSIIKSICELDSFLINDPDHDKYIECIIDGYYFKITDIAGLGTGELTFYINVPATGLLSRVDSSATNLDDETGTGNFYGLAINDSSVTHTASLTVRSADGKWVNRGWLSGFRDADGNWLSFPKTINNIFDANGMIKPEWIYDGAKHIFENITVRVPEQLSLTAVGNYNQAIHIDNNGKPQVSFKVNYQASDDPSTYPAGSDGDLLFIYK